MPFAYEYPTNMLQYPDRTAFPLAALLVQYASVKTTVHMSLHTQVGELLQEQILSTERIRRRLKLVPVSQVVRKTATEVGGNTIEPMNNGHVGDEHLSEVVLSSEVELYGQNRGRRQKVCPL